jgi:hypothetical protein
MKAKLLLSTILCVVPCLGWAEDRVTVTSNNSSLTFVRNDGDPKLGIPALPGFLEWTVDGRTTLVYPSQPWAWTDVDHFHSGLHVGKQQIHAQGQIEPDVTGGVVYTLEGGIPGSGISILTEKADIRNKKMASDFDPGTAPVPVYGFGYAPNPPCDVHGCYPIPDLTGLHLEGNSIVFYQGKTGNYFITDNEGGFPPSFVRYFNSFTGFNPVAEVCTIAFQDCALTLQPGSMLTMITVLRQGPPGLTKKVPAVASAPSP